MFDRTGILRELVRVGACKVLTGNVESRVRVDLRTRTHPSYPGPMAPVLVRRVAGLMYNRITKVELDFNAIAGLPLAGEPFADALQGFCGAGVGLIRLYKISGDGKRSIEVGKETLRNKQRVILLNEVVDRGDLTLKAARDLWSKGFEVVAVLAVVDRCAGGEEILSTAGMKGKLISMYTLPEMLDEMVRIKRISPSNRRQLQEEIEARHRRTLRTLRSHRL